MLTANAILRVATLGLSLTFVVTAQPVLAFDGSRSDNIVASAPAIKAMEDAFRSGTQSLKTGDKAKGVQSLEYAAERGHALAQWKLGRMYQAGDGVEQDDLKAFEYFRGIAANHADDNPDGPQARFVASAFVALGHYYLEGIPNTKIKAEPSRARQMFDYAASYFRDAEAQYYLARMYLNGTGAPQDPRTAARWFGLSAQKGQCQAQAMLGAMLFAGDHVPRQAARGVMWLTLARDACRSSMDENWVANLYDSAYQQSTQDERALALVYLKRWMEARKD